MAIFKRVIIAVFLFSGAAHAQIIDVSLSPSTKTVSPGEAFSMDIFGSLSATSGLTTIDGGGLLLSYDAVVINLDSVTYGTPFVDLGTLIDNTAGTAALAFLDLAGTGVADSSSFLIGTLFMTAGDPPSAPSTLLDLTLDPDNLFLYDYVNEIAPADTSVTGGTVNVVPLPAAVWLMLSSLAMLGVIGRRNMVTRGAIADSRISGQDP